MRYKEGEIPPDQLAVHASDHMLLFTAVISLFIGAVLFFLGRKGKQMWMWTWGIGLIICSVFMWLAVRNNWDLASYF